ncbi:hypothetical protein L2E82_27314 [Cichorium intybus]|uniref:Uncharacterized protein n=1 Tax=Cichorium intybus TaxID=13427 RepID=A0ACB9CSN0_CICIN|nr:hypothetical protein L2E82_27314 [Cichorium intybus]
MNPRCRKANLLRFSLDALHLDPSAIILSKDRPECESRFKQFLHIRFKTSCFTSESIALRSASQSGKLSDVVAKRFGIGKDCGRCGRCRSSVGSTTGD